MNKNQVLKELEKIDSDFQAELKEQLERYSRLRELVYNIPDIERKYKNNDFSPEEAKLVDEFQDLFFYQLFAWEHKQEKLRELDKKIHDENLQKMLDERFALMRQGNAINELAKITTSKNVQLEPFTGTANINKGDFLVTIEDFSALAGLRTSTHKLLDEIMTKFTDGNEKSLIVNIPLSEHMTQRGLKDEKEARKQVKEDLETLSKITLSFKQEIEGKRKDFLNLKIIGSHGIKNGVIMATLDAAFHELILKYQVMPMHRSFLALSDKYNPNSYHLGRRIALHKNMNYGKTNEDLISVLTLLDACPNLANHEEIYNHGKSDYKRRIIEPFERDMNALEEVFTWEYCHSNGLPLSDKELENFNYDVFKNLLIKIHWKNYPTRELKTLKEKPKKKGRRKSSNTNNNQN